MNSIKRIIAVGLLIGCVTACKVPTPPPVLPKSSDEALAGPAASKPPEKHSTDIGDIESLVRIRATLSEQSKTPTVTVDEMIDTQNRLNMATITVTPPCPKQLWIGFEVTLVRPITEGAAVLRAKVYRDKNEVSSFTTLISPALSAQPDQHSVDVLAGLDATPDTMLVYAQAELILLPPGTDPATVDAKSVTGTADTTGTSVGNPVRINFKR